MNTFTGTIEAASVPKPGKNPWGKEYVKYAFNIEGSWYGYFANDTADPAVTAIVETLAKGMVVSGNAKETDRGFVNIVDVKIEGGDEVPVGSFTTKDENVSQGLVSPPVSKAVQKSNDRDYRITYLASRKDAINTVTALLAADLLDLGKKADALDNFNGFVNDLTDTMAEKAMAVGAPTDDE